MAWIVAPRVKLFKIGPVNVDLMRIPNYEPRHKEKPLVLPAHKPQKAILPKADPYPIRKIGHSYDDLHKRLYRR